MPHKLSASSFFVFPFLFGVLVTQPPVLGQPRGASSQDAVQPLRRDTPEQKKQPAGAPDFVLQDTLRLPILGHAKRLAVAHTSDGGFWRTDGGFLAQIRMKNALVVAPLEIAPVLYMADGTEYRLPAITLPEAGVGSININEALSHAPPSVAAHLSTFGSASLTYIYSSSGHLIASVHLQDNSRSLSLMYPFSESDVAGGHPASNPTIMDGVWWKHDAKVRGFVALSNSANQKTEATIQLVSASGELEEPKRVNLAPHSTQMFPLETGRDGLGAAGRAGGVRVEYIGGLHTIAVAGGLLNAREGYSANIPFTTSMSSTVGPITLGSAGIMVGKPDPMMRFPADTSFTPYLVLRNTTTKPLPIALEISNVTDTAPVLRRAKEILAPLGTQFVNLHGIVRTLGMKNLNGSINLGISYTGLLGDVVMATGSVDESGTYVFEVQPQVAGSTHRKIGSYWDLYGDNNAMYSLWNPTEKEQDILAILYYAGGRYKLPLHLAPQGSIMLDIKQIVEANVPDVDGNVFPQGTTEGSATFESAKGPDGQMNVVIAGAVFNVVTATCIGCCTPCCGTSDLFIDPSSDFCTVGVTQQFQATAEQCDGTDLDETTGGDWSSDNTAVATVNSSGLMNPEEIGTDTLLFTANLPASSDCGQPLPGECPMTNFQASAPVTVFSATMACSPSSVTRGQSATCSITVTGTTSSTTITYSGWQFTDGKNTVTSSNSTASWSGAIVTSGTVSANVAVQGGASVPVSASLSVNPRSGFAFAAVNPSQVSANTITCYDGSVHSTPSPPSSGSIEGFSCPDLAYSFQSATISDNGPNNGYEYVTSASDVNGNLPTKFEYIVVSDLLNSASTFYVSQCGTFSASNTSGFIAGSQLKQNVFDHEQGSVLSHWTEYRDAQNDKANNVGIALESALGAPGSTGGAFAKSAGDAAVSKIGEAVNTEPCGGLINKDSSQSCKTCGAVNYSPYQSCGTVQPMPFCQ